MSDLVVTVSAEELEALKSGRLTEYQRPLNATWIQRLVNQKYDRLVFQTQKGKNSDAGKAVFDYKGYQTKRIGEGAAMERVFVFMFK